METGRRKITAGAQIFDVTFHSSWDLTVIGLITGEVELWGLNEENGSNVDALRNKFTHHQGSSCRGIVANAATSTLFSVSSDKSWVEVNELGKAINRRKAAHESAINRVQLVNERTIATGDDQGIVKLWDTRTTKREVMMWDAHTDFISTLQFYPDQHTLLSAGGDATLCVYDIRNQAHFYKSDDQEAELTGGLCVVDDGRRVAIGGDNGAILMFKWGDWGDCFDRMVGHPEAITSMVKYDERTVITGCEDSLIRMVQIRPQKLLGVLADIETAVEGLSLNEERSTLAVYGQSEQLQFLDLRSLLDDEDGDDGEAEDDEEAEIEADEEHENEVEEEGNDEDEDANEDEEWEDINENDDEEESVSESEGDDSSEEDDDSSDKDQTSNTKYPKEDQHMAKDPPESNAQSSSPFSSSPKNNPIAEQPSAKNKVSANKPTPPSNNKRKRNEKDEDDDEECDSDSDSDDDEGEDDDRRGGKNKNKNKAKGRKFLTANERFYSDL